jgi:hypothetical protein
MEKEIHDKIQQLQIGNENQIADILDILEMINDEMDANYCAHRAEMKAIRDREVS